LKQAEMDKIRTEENIQWEVNSTEMENTLDDTELQWLQAEGWILTNLEGVMSLG